MNQRQIETEHMVMSIYKKFMKSGEPLFSMCRQENVGPVESNYYPWYGELMQEDKDESETD